MAVPVLETGYSLSVTAGVQTSITLTAASSIAVGDLLLLVCMDDADNITGTSLWDTPTGYTSLGSVGDGNDTWTHVFWKIAEAGDIASNVTVTHGGVADELMGWQLRVSGADTTTPVHLVGTGATGASATITIPSITTTVIDCLAFYVQSSDGGDAFPFSQSGTGWTQNAEGQENTDGNTVSGSFGTKSMATAGDTLNAVVNATVSDGYAAFQFAITAPVADTVDDLLADDIESSSEVTTPIVGQGHALLADDIESSSEVTAPVIAQTHVLLADDIESASELTLPTVTESHALLADDIESLSEVTTPVITEIYNLTVVHVESASEVTTPVITQSHTLLADDAESLSEVSNPVIVQVHALLADDIESVSEVSLPVVAESNILLADDIESSSEVTNPAITQSHVLNGTDIESVSEVSAPVITQIHVILAEDVESASDVTNPVLAESTGADDLLAEDIESLSEVSLPVIAQIHALLADDIESVSEVSNPVLDGEVPIVDLTGSRAIFHLAKNTVTLSGVKTLSLK